MTTSQAPVNDRREIFGWAMYDWANSAFSTTVGTVFLGPYIASLAAKAAESILMEWLASLEFPSRRIHFSPIVFHSQSGLQVLFLPILGAIADYSHLRKRMMQIFATIGARCNHCNVFCHGRFVVAGRRALYHCQSCLWRGNRLLQRLPAGYCQ